jgi:hypothetical protein
VIGHTLGGFVAGEGWFGTKRRGTSFVDDGSPRLAFVFAVTVARRDEPLLHALQRFLGAGSILRKPPGQPHHQPLSELSITSLREHHRATIPFAETYLPPCHKRDQFEQWVEQLQRYEERSPSRWGRGRSPCSIEGCVKPVRGRGLCRSHYYRATGY